MALTTNLIPLLILTLCPGRSIPRGLVRASGVLDGVLHVARRAEAAEFDDPLKRQFPLETSTPCR